MIFTIIILMITIALCFYFRLYGTRCSKCCHLITQSDWIRRAGDQVGHDDDDDDEEEEDDDDDDDDNDNDNIGDDDNYVRRRMESISKTKLFRFSTLLALPATLAHAKSVDNHLHHHNHNHNHHHNHQHNHHHHHHQHHHQNCSLALAKSLVWLRTGFFASRTTLRSTDYIHFDDK